MHVTASLLSAAAVASHSLTASADPSTYQPFFYPLVEIGVGSGFGSLHYDGPIAAQPGTSPEGNYTASLHGLLGFARLGAGYAWTQHLGAAAYVFGSLASATAPTIPGAGLTGYSSFGLGGSIRWSFAEGSGPVIEGALGYDRMSFGSNRDAIWSPGIVTDEGAFTGLGGILAEAAFGWQVVAGSWMLEPRMGALFFGVRGEHASVSVLTPFVGFDLR